MKELSKELKVHYLDLGFNAAEAKLKIDQVVGTLSDPNQRDKHMRTILRIYADAEKDAALIKEHGFVATSKVKSCAAELEAQSIQDNLASAYIHQSDFNLFKTAIFATQ